MDKELSTPEMITEIYKDISKMFKCNLGGVVRVDHNYGGLHWWIENKDEQYGGHYNGRFKISQGIMLLDWSSYKAITE
jgi:hypothetical protein